MNRYYCDVVHLRLYKHLSSSYIHEQISLGCSSSDVVHLMLYKQFLLRIFMTRFPYGVVYLSNYLVHIVMNKYPYVVVHLMLY